MAAVRAPKRAFTLPFPQLPEFEERDGRWWLDVDGHRLALSHLDKVFWPETGITKGDLVAYYWNVAEAILPHLHGRPLTLRRMPDGAAGPHFFQKSPPAHTPAWVPRCPVTRDGETTEMLHVKTAADLLFMIGLGCIDLHPLHSRCGALDRPDYLVFDLDPSPPSGFAETLAVAQQVGAALEALGLRGYPKTSGATGLQVYVPVAPHHSYAETRSLTEHLGRLLLQANPERVTMEWSLDRRPGKVFIDHNMNRPGANIASVYSVRPEPAATVSMPITWQEVAAGRVRPEMFTMTSAVARLHELGDLFVPPSDPGQDLGPSLQRLGVLAGGVEGRRRGRGAGSRKGSAPAGTTDRAAAADKTPAPARRHAATDPRPPSVQGS